MVRLASVEFTKLKHVRPGTRLTFSEAGAVLLGKNGTGKTTLLNYLVALCTADASAFSGDEPFDVSATFSWSSGITAALRMTGTPGSKSEFDSIEPTTDLERRLLSSELTQLRFQIALASPPQEYTAILTDGLVELYQGEEALCTPYRAPAQYSLPLALWKLAALLTNSAPPTRDNHPVAQIGLDLIELQDTLLRYDEGLDHFKSLTEAGSSYLMLEIIVARLSSGRALAQGSKNRFPFDLVNALIVSATSSPEPESFSAKHTAVSMLTEFTRLCELSGATAIAPIDSRHIASDVTMYKLKSLRFMFDIGDDRISHASLSFGQKRLLSYLYYLACNTHIGVADELVNGMHHAWIEYCLGPACEGRQMFYTTQNPLLLDFLIFETEAEVSERFVTCTWDPEIGFIWENLEPRVGEEFYRLYRTGIQHVSDILRTKGWW